jgi:uncharacterized GH25 family protein
MPAAAAAGLAVLLVAAAALFLSGGWPSADRDRSDPRGAPAGTWPTRSDASDANERRADDPIAQRPSSAPEAPASADDADSEAARDDASPDDAAKPAGVQLALRILDAETAAPIAGAEFSLLLRGPRRTRSLRLTSDAEGVCVLSDLAPATYAARLRHPEYLADHRDLTVLPAQEAAPDAPPIEIRLHRGESLEGTVVDARGGGVRGARLTLTRRSADADTPERRSAASGEDGAFRFAALAQGTWTLTASHAAHRSFAPLEIEVPAASPLAIVLPDDLPAALRVLDPGGAPLAGARVEVRVGGLGGPGASAQLVAPARSDAQGNALLRRLPADPALAVVLEGHHADFPDARVATTVGALDAGGVELRFERGREARGKVVDAGGKPVADAQVEISGPKSLVLRSTSAGEFHFKKLPPGAYTMRASTHDRGVSAAQSIDLSANPTEEVVLTLERGDGVIAGRVLDAAERPIALALLTLEGEERRIQATTDARGAFRFAGLPEGSYRLSAGDRRRGHEVVEGVATSREDLVVRLVAPGAIRGRIAAEGPGAGFTLRLREAGAGDDLPARVYRFTSRVSSFHLEHLPPGAYRLELLRGGEVVGAVERIDVRSGETTDGVVVADAREETSEK